MSGVIAEVSVVPPASGVGVDVLFSFPPTGDTMNLPLRDRAVLDTFRTKAGEYLSRVVPLVARLNVTTRQAARAMEVLLNAGGMLTEILVQDRPERLLELQDKFRAAWPVWARADWGDPDLPLPIVQMNCHDDTVPLEMLPVFDFGALDPIRTYDDLVRAASRFLGFAAMVRRVVPGSIDADRVIHNDPALPVQFLRHKRLRDALREEQFLESLTGHVRVDGPWPVAEDGDAVQATLLRALYAGHGLDGSGPADPPVQIHHFACHCDTTSEDFADYTLGLSTKGGWRRDITFGQLRQEYRQRLAEDRELGRHRAIIMLNACGSSRTDPRSAVSFPRWFVARGHRAFIGTETFVPDRVASGFAAAFYGRLLEARRPLGDAVVWARRDLLRDYRNPLGLLYVTYGDTDLVIEHARPGAYRAQP